MENPSVLFIIIALLGSGIVSDGKLCDTEYITRCERMIEGIYDEGDSPFLSDETLSNNCSDIQRSLDCNVDLVRNCRGKEQLDEYLSLTSSISKLIGDLCNGTSTIREAYRQHVSCFRSAHVANAMKNCLKTVEESARQKLEDEGRVLQSRDEADEYACSFYQPFINCLERVANENCEEGADDTIRQLLNRAPELPRHTVCETILSNLEYGEN